MFLSAAGAAAMGPDGTGAETGVWAAVVGMPDGRPLRRLCREHGPWRTVPLRFTEAAEVARAFDAADVALVVDGGRRDGPPPTLVDATVSPIRVLREGALPASFIEGTMLMSTRRRLFSRQRPTPVGLSTAVPSWGRVRRHSDREEGRRHAFSEKCKRIR